MTVLISGAITFVIVKVHSIQKTTDESLSHSLKTFTSDPISVHPLQGYTQATTQQKTDGTTNDFRVVDKSVNYSYVTQPFWHDQSQNIGILRNNT